MEKTCGSIPLNQYILPRRGSQDRSAWIEHSPLSRCDWSLLKRSVSFWKVELVNLSARYQPAYTHPYIYSFPVSPGARWCLQLLGVAGL
jgi:hypothetical protein